MEPGVHSAVDFLCDLDPYYAVGFLPLALVASNHHSLQLQMNLPKDNKMSFYLCIVCVGDYNAQCAGHQELVIDIRYDICVEI